VADDKSNGPIEIVVAIVLSVAGLSSSWASYQAALWDGEQASHYSLANALHTQASSASLDASTWRALEISMFGAWLEAKSTGNERLADFYMARIPPDLKPALDEWLAQKPLQTPNAAATPFKLPSYSPAGLKEAQAIDARADAVFAEGQHANKVSDDFTQGAVILAMSMFFGGIGQVFRFNRVRMVFAAVAALTCAIGLIRILALPSLAAG